LQGSWLIVIPAIYALVKGVGLAERPASEPVEALQPAE
jgi:hypothetical protein